jgi:hypothetical protein
VGCQAVVQPSRSDCRFDPKVSRSSARIEQSHPHHTPLHPPLDQRMLRDGARNAYGDRTRPGDWRFCCARTPGCALCRECEDIRPVSRVVPARITPPVHHGFLAPGASSSLARLSEVRTSREHRACSQQYPETLSPTREDRKTTTQRSWPCSTSGSDRFRDRGGAVLPAQSTNRQSARHAPPRSDRRG